MKKLYRAESIATGSYDYEYGSSSIILADVYVVEYEVVKETKCGYRVKPISPFPSIQNLEGTKWFSKKSRNPFAVESELDALSEFARRKSRQLYIMRRKIRYIEAAKNVANSMIEKYK